MPDTNYYNISLSYKKYYNCSTNVIYYEYYYDIYCTDIINILSISTPIININSCNNNFQTGCVNINNNNNNNDINNDNI